MPRPVDSKSADAPFRCPSPGEQQAPRASTQSLPPAVPVGPAPSLVEPFHSLHTTRARVRLTHPAKLRQIPALDAVHAESDEEWPQSKTCELHREVQISRGRSPALGSSAPTPDRACRETTMS